MSNVKIGIVGSCGLWELKERTGGTPVISVPDALKKDILIFSGGEDISPSLYGEENRSCFGVNGGRDAFEKEVFTKAYFRGIKILGICRGHQLINALLGGKLYQDITADTGIHHTKEDHLFTTDSGTYWKNRSLAEIFKTTNSLHHQSVSIPGNGLMVILKARDGIIESTANKTGSIVSFQFHPEWLRSGINYFLKVVKTGELIW